MYLGRVAFAAALIVGSLAVTEPSLYGLAISTASMLALVAALALALHLLAAVFPALQIFSVLRSAPVFGASVFLMHHIAFSNYLEGGTYFSGDIPYIINGDVQVAGYVYVLSYALVLTAAVRLIERTRPPTA